MIRLLRLKATAIDHILRARNNAKTISQETLFERRSFSIQNADPTEYISVEIKGFIPEISPKITHVRELCARISEIRVYLRIIKNTPSKGQIRETSVQAISAERMNSNCKKSNIVLRKKMKFLFWEHILYL